MTRFRLRRWAGLLLGLILLLGLLGAGLLGTRYGRRYLEQELRQRLAEGSDLRLAAGVLGWDQRVTMPPRGTDSRAEQLATLGRIAHERFVDPEVGRLLDACELLVEGLPYDSDDHSLVRVTRRLRPVLVYKG